MKIKRDLWNWEMKEKVIFENMIYEYKNEKFYLWTKKCYKEIEIDWEEFHIINIINTFLNQKWKNYE